MAGRNIQKYSSVITVTITILSAMVLRQINIRVEGPMDQVLLILRSMLYIGLYIGWGISVRSRILQPLARRCLTAVSALMVFWMTARTIRYLLADPVRPLRGLWYLYYLPMLWIPLLAVWIALSLRKPDDFRLPRQVRLLCVPASALLLMVLTNDLHQMVFVFPVHSSEGVNDYQYAFGYFLAVGWMISCTVFALAVMLVKCRVPHSRNFLLLPFAPVMAAVFYGVLYILRIPWLKPLAGDMTVVFCLLIAAALESCIASGLIQSNTGYDELFLVSRLGAQILDSEYRVCLVSRNARAMTREQRVLAGVQSVSIAKSLQVRSQPIGFGYVLWQEDVSKLADAIEQSEENCRELAERNRIRQENLELQKKILALREKNRISDLLHRETAGQIRRIDSLLARYERETDERERGRLLAAAAAAGAYIKRYGNLLLAGERSAQSDLGDLARCFAESFLYLELLDVNCLQTLPSGRMFPTKEMLRAYRGFEEAVEGCLPDLSQVWISLRDGRDVSVLFIELVSGTPFRLEAVEADSFSCEDGACRFSFRLTKGGEG